MRFRPAPTRSLRLNLLWTALQSVVIWAITLGVVPALLVMVKRYASIESFTFAGQWHIAAALFVVASMLNVASGATLAVEGLGTPLPIECPQRLVIGGPYRYVRNPMAIAGISQGVAVAVWLGSWTVLFYALAGAALWHVAIGPREERDLARRFGADYESYQSAVRLWWPTGRAAQRASLPS